MKLYEVPKGCWFRVVQSATVPIESLPAEPVISLKLGNIDGMYSYCTDIDGNVYHPAAYTEVTVE